MQDNIRGMEGEDPVNGFLIDNIRDLDPEIQVRVLAKQLLLDFVGAIFIDVQQHQPARSASCDLPCQLRPDGSAAACNQDTFSFVVVTCGICQEIFRISEQKILNIEIVEYTAAGLPECGIVIALDLITHPFIDFVQFLPALSGNIRQCKHHLLNAKSLKFLTEAIRRSNYRNAVNLSSDLSLVYFHKTGRFVICFRILDQLIRQHGSDRPGSDDRNTDPVRICFFIGKRGACQHAKKEKRNLLKPGSPGPPQVHPLVEHPDHDTAQEVRHHQGDSPDKCQAVWDEFTEEEKENRCKAIRGNQGDILHRTGIAPDLLIQTKSKAKTGNAEPS